MQRNTIKTDIDHVFILILEKCKESIAKLKIIVAEKSGFNFSSIFTEKSRLT